MPGHSSKETKQIYLDSLKLDKRPVYGSGEQDFACGVQTGLEVSVQEVMYLAKTPEERMFALKYEQYILGKLQALNK